MTCFFFVGPFYSLSPTPTNTEEPQRKTVKTERNILWCSLVRARVPCSHLIRGLQTSRNSRERERISHRRHRSFSVLFRLSVVVLTRKAWLLTTQASSPRLSFAQVSVKAGRLRNTFRASSHALRSGYSVTVVALVGCQKNLQIFIKCNPPGIDRREWNIFLIVFLILLGELEWSTCSHITDMAQSEDVLWRISQTRKEFGCSRSVALQMMIRLARFSMTFCKKKLGLLAYNVHGSFAWNRLKVPRGFTYLYYSKGFFN